MKIDNKTNNFLNSVCNKIKYAPVRNTIKNELLEHILEEKQNYIANGMTNEEAEQKAISNMGTAEEISNEFNKIYKRQLDWKLLIILMALIGINILLTLTVAMQKNNDISYILRNGIYIFVGIAISIILYFTNYKIIKKYYIGIGILGLALSIIHLYLYSTNNFEILNDLHINLNIIAILAYIIAFASSINTLDIYNKRDLIITSVFTIFSLMLLYLSNDIISFYTLLTIYVILTAITVFRSNSKNFKKIMVAIILTILLFSTFTITIAQPHLLRRMINNDDELSIMHDRLDKSYLIGNANIPKDINTDYYYLEFSNYSFIFLIEHYGKIFGILVIAILALLSIKIILSYRVVNDKLGKLLIIGIGAFIFIQVLANLLTILGILNIGMTGIPFVTHNSANIIVYIISIALILSIYSRKNINIKELDINNA